MIKCSLVDKFRSLCRAIEELKTKVLNEFTLFDLRIMHDFGVVYLPRKKHPIIRTLCASETERWNLCAVGKENKAGEAGTKIVVRPDLNDVQTPWADSLAKTLSLTNLRFRRDEKHHCMVANTL